MTMNRNGIVEEVQKKKRSNSKRDFDPDQKPGHGEFKGQEKLKQGKSLDFYHAALSFLIALSAWPMCYVFNTVFSTMDPETLPVAMLAIGGLLLSGVVVATVKLSKIRDWIYYGSTCFQFTCMITFMISLEHLGFISGFMAFYREFGEKYLLSSYGLAVCFFDGLGFQAMYIFMIFQLSNRKSWRSMAIYYSVALITNMALIVSGYLVGNLDFVPCALLNVPYFIFPAYALARALAEESPSHDWDEKVKRTVFLTHFDILLVAGFLVSIVVTILKGGAVLGSELPAVKWLLSHDNAIMLRDPAPFATFQVLMYLFYCPPIQVFSLFYLLRGKMPAMLWEGNLMHAGLLLPGQLCYIFAAIFAETPAEFRCDPTSGMFWLINLVILVVPHLFIYRLSLHRRKLNTSVETSALRKNL